MDRPINYKDSGVDIDAGNESVSRIRPLVKATHNETVLAGIGSFGGMIDLGPLLKDYKHPVLVQSIDSVGTKLMVANMAGKHDTIGIDMVAHSCNDILCQGARPISFLDYIAVGKLRPRQVEEILQGISIACEEVDLPVIGGEIAELPGVYSGDEYELVGAVTGVVERDKIITGKKIASGDVVIGIASDGLHTNGYSLARKVLFEKGRFTVNSIIEELGGALGDELLRPHRNYTNPVLKLLYEEGLVKGMAHITGGGLVENVPRILPQGVDVHIQTSTWEVPPVFVLIQSAGRVPRDEMYRTFNMGVGMVIIVGEGSADKALDILKGCGEDAKIVGKVAGPGAGTVKLD